MGRWWEPTAGRCCMENTDNYFHSTLTHVANVFLLCKCMLLTAVELEKKGIVEKNG